MATADDTTTTATTTTVSLDLRSENRLRVLECADHVRRHLTSVPLDDDVSFLSDETYLRYARARDGDPEKALLMLEATIAWRRTYQPHRIDRASVAAHLEKPTMWQMGRDRQGNALIIARPGSTNPFPPAERVKFLVFSMEQATRSATDKMTWVIDWSLWGQRKNDPDSAETRKLTIQILQDHYPERLAALYMVDQPWFMTAFYYMSAPFVNSKTRAKVHISYTREKLLEVIDREQLVDFLGGLLVSGAEPSPSSSSGDVVDPAVATP